MNNVIIASGDLISGVTSWAFRVREAFCDHPSIKIHVVNCLNQTETTGKFDHFANSDEAFRSLLQQFSNPIVIPNYFWNLFKICDQLRKEGKQLKIIGYCRSDSKEEYYSPLETVEHCLDCIVAVSPKCREQLKTYLPAFDSKKVFTIPTGIKVPRSLMPKPPMGKIQIGYGGRFEKIQKRFFDLIPLIGNLISLKTSFHLNIAGAGRLIKEFEEELDRMDYRQYVSIIGKLLPNQMADFWGKNHIMVSLSDYEGTSNSMLEAMANGCVPVVSKTESGLETIEDGKNGFLFPIGDTKTAAEKINHLRRNSELLKETSLRAWKTAQTYSLESHSLKFESMISFVNKGDQYHFDS